MIPCRPRLGASDRTRRSPPSRDDFLARARRNVPVRIIFPHPLSWWRTRFAGDFKPIDIFIIRHFLSKSAIIGEPHWHLAAAGDAAVAIGVALRAQRRGGDRLVSLDVAMSAVLCCALEGHATAALLMASALKRHSGIDQSCACLSEVWLRFEPKQIEAKGSR